MAREHRKDKAHHRSREAYETHRSHKSHKAHKPRRVHKSKRDASESSLNSPVKEKVLGFSVSEQKALFAALAEASHTSQKTHATKTRRFEHSPWPFKANKARSPPKAPRTVSIAGVFKRPNQQPLEKKIKQMSPDPPLAIKIQNELEDAYAMLQGDSKLSFDSIHARFCLRIQKTRERDAETLQLVSEAVKKLSAPLVEEKVEIEMIKHGKRVKETVTIGKRIISFKAYIENEGANLSHLWRQWEDVQDEYMELGLEVFGVEALGDNPNGEIAREQGFKKEMEEQDLQHTIAIEELNEEVGELNVKIMKRMKASEKELDVQTKKDQEVFLRTLLFV